MSPTGIALIGAGTISKQYLDNLTKFPSVKVVSIGDIDTERAAEVAANYGVGHSGTAAEAIAHPEAEIVVNLTIPAAHVEVARAALAAGKHVYGEKPFALSREEGRKLLEEARAKGLRLGSAPDTFLGAGVQTSLRALQAGEIGRPLFAMTAMQSPGPESWHPNPAFLFQKGAGPLWDIGPYYLTLLVALLGPATRVSAVGRKSKETRTVGSGPLAGTEFEVEVPTHVAANVEFASGQVASVILSFDSQVNRHGFVEINGTGAALKVPDPNGFDGEVGLRSAGDKEWAFRPSEGASDGRGTGVVEMAQAIRGGRPHRASAELALHVVDLMEAIAESADTGEFVQVDADLLEQAGGVPEPLPVDWDPKTV
ncbi:oxidoreductase [Mangrovactinospora gilvigrisea]|uniref:Oxidoreductase n=1 Tax=Mangrovactinospora gilvigrisea TaxID=1428644 RepID=A0A1J7B9H8_9ACTN|nr:Gfo/Idh/MocA family oxidoreductase [Mangrovactinospora gilvigrisea]OIV35327.1 oxidoreductase [Mangrovactinospora gilvigrisea]